MHDTHDIPSGGVDLDAYLRQLDDESLTGLRLDLQEDLGEIKDQLRDARAKVHISGVYSDNDWYRRAMGAQRVKANQYNAACAEVGRRRKRFTVERESTWERAFVNAAKERLTGAQFNELVARAHEIQQETAP